MTQLQMITLEKLLGMKVNNEPFTLVETLGEDAYREKHIPGAVNIPTPHDMTAGQMAEEAEQQNVDADNPVVVYCASYTCGASTRAARLLVEAGFTNVMDYKGGKALWQSAGFEFE